MTVLILRQGLLVHRDRAVRGDIVVRDGVIAEIGEHLEAPVGAQVIDAQGCWVGPGFVDLHTHLREPGREEAETIASGAAAAIAGGYCAVVAMPNTEPALDTPSLVGYVIERGRRTGIDVAVAGAITQGRQGERLAPMAEMAALGVRLFTDDGMGVQDPLVMRRACEYSVSLGVTLAQHCEDEHLANGGSMNEGALSGRLGLIGRPALAEELMVMRDIELARLTGARLHFLHLSTARSIALLHHARLDGLKVSCEVTPHHLTLDESACATFDPEFKVHPPLRTRSDVAELRRALGEGLIDAVATDHAPHAAELKDLAFDEAPAGMLGLEHSAALAFEALGGVDSDPRRFFDVMSRGPARVAQLTKWHDRSGFSAHGGDLEVGDDANLVVFNPGAQWTADRFTLRSRSINTPYHGRAMIGRVQSTVVRGVVRFNEGDLV